MNEAEFHYFNHFNLMHMHNFFELIFVDKGRLTVKVDTEKKQLFSGDLLLIDRNTYHLELRRDSEELTYFLGIPEEIINQWAKEKSIYFKKNAVMSNLLSHQGNSKNDQHTSFLLRTLGHNTTAESFQRLEQEFKQKKPGYSLLIAGLTIRLLDSLSNSSQFKIESIKTQSSNSNELSELIKQYIDNKKQKISYDELSHTFGYNGKYLNRVFKKSFGVSIHAYIIKICMEQADEYLMYSKLSITEIVSQLNFSNRTNFNNVFIKKHGITPSEFRGKYNSK
ncbi:AraC family transcriptional regulator [Secundilactobacillus collinoides]|uniref:HTH araC/xylS-type domain-containing protein n=2 Tax=Secundilactobacillus collinoides TaxID=33960 RepID=A0A0R2B8Z6_SECCO|nr:AraC family transcriptional regulator [Secundilactobacillus collinoides]KRM75822.1 hypothetical protein FC82_GL001971 [Secundilactobacillus collinoides DSM 20515 = JCM 1123]KZL39423.1 hypothetical protein TY91_10550 [Secundilactobacillus collinoides]